AIVICVPTPLGKSKEPDISFIVGAADAVARVIRRGQLVVLESTTYPGTTQEILLPRFQTRGLVAGRDVFIAFSPERIDPGNRRWTVRDIPKGVGGVPGAGRGRAGARACREPGRAGLGTGDRRDGETLREHVPFGQHRAGQRVRDHVPPAGLVSVGSDCRRVDQAVWLHAVLSGPRARRPLSAVRPALPLLEGAPGRLRTALHHVRGRDQPPHARLRRADGRGRAQRPKPRRSGRKRPL